MKSLSATIPATLGVCLALALSSVCSAQIPRSVIATYRAGLHGNAEANSQAIDTLKKLVKKDPTDALASAFLGASETVHARYVDHPWEKVKSGERGLSRLEKSLHLLSKDDQKSEPGRLSVHDLVVTTVGCTFVAVPPMFHRFDEGYSLLKTLVASKSFATTSGRAQAHAWLCAAKAAVAAKDRDHAKAYISDLIKAAPTGPLHEQAEQLQAKLDD